MFFNQVIIHFRLANVKISSNAAVPDLQMMNLLMLIFLFYKYLSLHYSFLSLTTYNIILLISHSHTTYTYMTNATRIVYVFLSQ